MRILALSLKNGLKSLLKICKVYMRLSKDKIEIINLLAQKYFSSDAQVYLFGSRTIDTAKGGDIDLFLHSDIESTLTLKNKALFLVELKRLIGDQKIDLVFDNEVSRSKINFYQSIKNKAVKISE